MIYRNEADFSKDIKNLQMQNLYLLYGSENYLIDMYVDMIKSIMIGDGNENFNLSIIDGKETNLQEISDTVESMPLLSEKRVVVLDNPDMSRIVSTTAFAQILSDIPTYTCLIIPIRNFDITPQKNKTHKELINLCDENGAVISLDGRNEEDLTKFIIATAKKGNAEIEKNEAVILIEKCSSNMQKITTEIAKLTAYVDGGKITQEVIEKVVVATVEAQIYDLSKMISAGNLDKAIAILDKLFYLREPPVVILSTLSYYFSDLYKAKIAKENAVPMSECSAVFGYKPNDFRIKNAFRDCTRYSNKYLSKIIEILAEADLDLKSSRLEDRFIIERAITQIFVSKDK
ncbi:MAG: DNA polymerase III subunit delta [Oscillospiraceae bacterium]